MYETITYDKTESVSTISLNRPKRLNALNGQVHPELLDALNAAARGASVKPVGDERGPATG